MKKGFLLLLLFCSVFAQGQSLKDALFRGKLKNDNNTVIRKGDDLSKMAPDTTRKVVADSTAQAKAALLTGDSATRGLPVPADSAALAAVNPGDSATAATDTAAVAATATEPAAPAPPRKDNNAMLKGYVDSVASVVKTEALPNKKIKKGMYYVTVSYSIGTDGQVEITDVYLSPENAYLHSQIKDRLELEAPRLEPVLNSSGTPRKVSRKYNFTLTKD